MGNPTTRESAATPISVERALAILRAVGAGEAVSSEQHEAACRVLARVLSRRVIPWARNKFPNLDRSDVNGVANERFTAFVQTGANRIGHTQGDFERWMGTVIGNALRTAARNKARRMSIEVELTAGIEARATSTDDVPDADGAERLYFAKDEADFLGALGFGGVALEQFGVDRAKFELFLSGLTDSDRALLEMKLESYSQQPPLSGEEMAARLGITRDNFFVRWHRLVERFKACCRR